MGCREGRDAAAPSTVKESPLRPCSGWWREKCWTDGWPARVPYTAGKKQLCLLTRGPLAANGRAVEGERRTPNCQPEQKWGWTRSAHQASKAGCDRFKWGERVRGGQKRFSGLTSPRNGETALLIPTRRSGMTQISRSGRPVGPLQVNPLVWLLAGKRPATGSPNRSRGSARGLGSTARGLLSGERLLPRHRGGGSGIVPWSPRHELLESSRLRFGWAELIHYSANCLPK